MTFQIDLEGLTGHGLVCGVTGSGKSTTCRSLLAALLEQGIPFLVIEPAKREYVDWARDRNRDKPGSVAVLDAQSPTEDEQLRINMFDVVRDRNGNFDVVGHLDRLKSLLIAAFPMQEILPVLLADVLTAAYTYPRNLLDGAGPTDSFPSLADVIDLVPRVVREKGYDPHITTNLIAALRGRLESLTVGSKRRLFSTRRSVDVHQYFSRPSVINISALGDDSEKALLMGLILQFLYEYRLGQGPSKTLQHLTLVEEAHRVLGEPHYRGLGEGNAQHSAAQQFAHALAEMRAYGESFVVVDQSPSGLIRDVLRNSSTKIVHRLESYEDVIILAQSSAMKDDQLRSLQLLGRGEAVVRQAFAAEPSRILVRS